MIVCYNVATESPVQSQSYVLNVVGQWINKDLHPLVYGLCKKFGVETVPQFGEGIKVIIFHDRTYRTNDDL